MGFYSIWPVSSSPGRPRQPYRENQGRSFETHWSVLSNEDFVLTSARHSVRKNKLSLGEGDSSDLNCVLYQTIIKYFDWTGWSSSTWTQLLWLPLSWSAVIIDLIDRLVDLIQINLLKAVSFCLVTFLIQIHFETCSASVGKAFLLLLNCHVGMQNKYHPAVLWLPQTLRYLGDKYSKHLAGGVSSLKQVLYSQPGDNPNFLVCERRKRSGPHLLS